MNAVKCHDGKMLLNPTKKQKGKSTLRGILKHYKRKSTEIFRERKQWEKSRILKNWRNMKENVVMLIDILPAFVGVI